MPPFWQTSFGKLVVGSCGVQMGLLLTLGGLVFVTMFCAVCAVTNVVGLGLARELARSSPPPVPVVASSSSSDEVNSLVQEVDLLLGQMDQLQAPQAIPVPVALPAGGRPVVMAGQSQVGLYGGPGIDSEQVDVLPPGETREIVGRNGNSTWWLVSLPSGRFAWAFNALVTALNVTDAIPVVTTPSELAQPAAFGSVAAASSTAEVLPPQEPTPTAIPTLPPGTPTPSADASRQYVEDLPAYQRVKAAFLSPPVSASLSPDGSQIAMTERIKLYTIGTAGAYTEIWVEDSDEMGPIGGVVWSPDGKYIAFVVGFKQRRYCKPCRAVGLLNLAERSITYLTPPEEGMDTDMPRWIQDGRLLINVHPGEPADGVAYVYNIYNESQKAEGVYILSASQEGQKWFPWQPGRVWRSGVSERADSYNSD
jgi:hypothetical protein